MRYQNKIPLHMYYIIERYVGNMAFSCENQAFFKRLKKALKSRDDDDDDDVESFVSDATLR